MNNQCSVPVITFDGPSACGKGTLSLMLAQRLKWNFLDSGALYRAVAWAVLYYDVDPNDMQQVIALTKRVNVKMQSQGPGKSALVFCDDYNITHSIRTEDVSSTASIISVIAEVRQSLDAMMLTLRCPPGLVADGRDMGTVVFPDAVVKFYLTADTATRAQRRYQQLKLQGTSVNLREIERDMLIRDQRDAMRTLAPSKPAEGVVMINTAELGIEEVFHVVMQHVHEYL